MGIKINLLVLLLLLFCGGLVAQEAVSDQSVSMVTPKKSIWVDGIGSGYVENAKMLDLSFTRGFGSTDYGGEVTHDLLLGRLTYSQSINEVWAPNKWYGGNLLFTAEIMGGIQDQPDTAYLIFGNAGLRYDFATKGRFVPFVNIAIGAGATAISEPDLSEGLQFTEQAGVGLRYYFNEVCSATLGFGYMHISNGGYKEPNGGVNSYMVTLGVGWAL